MFPLLGADAEKQPGAQVPRKEEPPAGTPRAGAESAPSAPSKVDLDLDDAPFLQKPAEEPVKKDAGPQEGGSKEAEADQDADADKAKKKKNKKKLILMAALVLLLVIAAAVYFLFLRGPGEKKAPEPEVVKVVVPTLAPPPPTIAPATLFHYEMEPFWVEVRDPEGSLRLLMCRFVVGTDDQRVTVELNVKKTVIRDAIYYYLRNRPYGALADPKHLPVIKEDVKGIISDYIVTEKVIDSDGKAVDPVKEVLFLDYRIE